MLQTKLIITQIITDDLKQSFYHTYLPKSQNNNYYKLIMKQLNDHDINLEQRNLVNTVRTILSEVIEQKDQIIKQLNGKVHQMQMEILQLEDCFHNQKDGDLMSLEMKPLIEKGFIWQEEEKLFLVIDVTDLVKVEDTLKIDKRIKVVKVNQDLKSQSACQRQLKDNYTELTNKLIALIDKNNQQFSQNSALITSLQSQIASKVETINQEETEYQKKIRKLQQEKNDLEEEIIMNKIESDQIEKERMSTKHVKMGTEDYIAKYEALKKESAEKTKQIGRLTDKIKEVELLSIRKIEQMQRRNQSILKVKDQLNFENQHLQQQKSVMKKQKTSIEYQYISLLQKYQELTQQNKRQLEQYKKIQEQLTTTNQQCQKLRAKLSHKEHQKYQLTKSQFEIDEEEILQNQIQQNKIVVENHILQTIKDGQLLDQPNDQCIQQKGSLQTPNGNIKSSKNILINEVQDSQKVESQKIQIGKQITSKNIISENKIENTVFVVNKQNQPRIQNPDDSPIQKLTEMEQQTNLDNGYSPINALLTTPPSEVLFPEASSNQKKQKKRFRPPQLIRLGY